jgi:uncharacterized circularly permuted ATP-grasp superfamily protein/uncharacterized alpha-E superfamily protein
MFASLKEDVLFQQYLNSGYNYEALLDSDENLRPQWETFFQSFNQLGYSEINSRHNAMLRLLKENGVTYNIYGDPDGLNRPWELDMLPFLVSKQEWDFIETGLTQRAELFNLILKDIYGERKLIKEGLLPMELVYRHSGFLRQCAGIDYTHKNSLVLYAADMARGSDGSIWVVNDRTQAPSGSGYALENRTAMSRVLPELFNGLKVRQLQPYFTDLRNALNDIAPNNQYNPRIVILTPGPNNETYFEHSYLASYLGLALVQGNDLIVKDNFVWLKTLEGLEKVDVILRRVDDVYCDPLELKEDSQLGIPGLLQAVRSGHVSIANPLGSSILENPGLMPFLENISHHFFGKGLLMPNIASWWCGQPKELTYVLSNLDSLVVKKIFRGAESHTSIDAEGLSYNDLEDLKRKIKADPQLYVAQEKVFIPPVPSLVNGKIEPRNSLFRSFLVSNGDGYTTMAGGLSRTSADSGNFIISNQSGGFSKDTWIIAPEPERILNALREVPEEGLSYTNAVLPSHTAENLFWVGRYTERVLGNARFMRTVVQYINEGNRLMEKNDIYTEHYLLKALTQYSYTSPGFSESKRKLENPLPELKDILFNEGRPGSLKSNYGLFNRAVFAVRDHWSMDVWRLLRGVDEVWATANEQQNINLGIVYPLDNLITSMVAFMGLNRESISREQGWIMLDAGRKIEQSLLLINMLLSTIVNKHNEAVEYNLQESVLISCESLVNYRYKYRAHIQLHLVLDLMLFDANNPRSLTYQLNNLRSHFTQLPKTQHPGMAYPEHERLLAEMFDLLKTVNKDQLVVADGRRKKYKHLEAFLLNINSLLMAVPEAISKVYFEHAQVQRQLFTAGNI